MPETAARTRVAFIGLGNMGSPMAARLVEAGYDVVGADPAPKGRDALVQAGGQAFEEPADALQGAQLVILMLPNSDIVESVILQPSAAGRIAEGAVVIDMSSSEPLQTRKLAEGLKTQYGVDLIDAPVSGGVTGAVNGSLTIMAGGSDALVDKAEECLSALGRIKRAGAIGSGHALKAFNNLLSATHLLATSEAMIAGQKFGLSPETMLEVINGSSGRSGSTENKWPNFILPETYNSGFALRLMLKDMKIATRLADELGIPSPLGQASVDLWEQAAGQLAETADHTEIARWVQEKTASEALS